MSQIENAENSDSSPTSAIPIEQNAVANVPTATPIDRVTIPIDPYPDIEEPYLQSFELLRANAYEAVFSLGRLANAFRFSQFLYHYRTSGRTVGVPPDFSESFSKCLSLLDPDTRSAVMSRLLICLNRNVHILALDGTNNIRSCVNVDDEGRIFVPFFRSPLSENYKFSRDTRKQPWDQTRLPTHDSSGWLDCFEVLYEKLLECDLQLAGWMLAGWNVDRLIRPEMDNYLLSFYFDDSHNPSLTGEPSTSPATNPGPIDRTPRLLCRVDGHLTKDPTHRNSLARPIFSSLGSSNFEQPQSTADFEACVSKWVRRCADERQTTLVSTMKSPIKIPDAQVDWEQKALLASLKTKPRLYVFCGRIWKKYRDEINEQLLKSKDGTAAKKGPRIEESFKLAVESGWNIDHRELFIRYAREGIKPNKPWSEFVHGNKGGNIPLEKFLEPAE